jgi:hypothetical protein
MTGTVVLVVPAAVVVVAVGEVVVVVPLVGEVVGVVPVVGGVVLDVGAVGVGLELDVVEPADEMLVVAPAGSGTAASANEPTTAPRTTNTGFALRTGIAIPGSFDEFSYGQEGTSRPLTAHRPDGGLGLWALSALRRPPGPHIFTS